MGDVVRGLCLVVSMAACGGRKSPEVITAEAQAAAEAVAVAMQAQAEAAAQGSDPSVEQPEDPDGGMGSPEALAVYRALAVRDPEPDCADIDALSPHPLQTLLDVIERASMPPWVPMRAANCVVKRHGGEAQATLLRWVVDEDSRGLAIVVFDGIDSLPEDTALAVAQAGLSGPWADDAAARLAASRRSSILALVQGDQP